MAAPIPLVTVDSFSPKADAALPIRSGVISEERLSSREADMCGAPERCVYWDSQSAQSDRGAHTPHSPAPDRHRPLQFCT